MKKNTTLRTAGAIAGLAAVGAVAFGGVTAATATTAKVINSVQIKGNNAPRFDAPETLTAGQDLQVVNKTDPEKIGPHTFSLVEKSELPKGREELKKCGKELKAVCKQIAKAHEINFETFEIGLPNVENGAPGWDATFKGKDQDGDTWFTETEDETTSRQVTAGAGNLWFMCAVHPDMQGKIKVLPAR